MIKLSICIVTLNDRENLIKTLNSISYSHEIEIIIQDGGSKYDIQSVISEFKDILPLIRFKQEKDCGIYDAMNKAIERCRGRYIQFLNCGDCIAENAQELLLCALSNVGEGFLCVKFLANVRNEGINIERANPFYFSRKMLNHQSMIYDYKCFQKVRFDPHLKIIGDLRHCLEADLIRRICYVDFVLIEYLNGGAASVKKGIRQNWAERSKSWNWRIPIYQKLILMALVLIRYLCHYLRIKPL